MAKICLVLVATSIFFFIYSSLAYAEEEDTIEYTREDLKQLYVGLVTAEEILAVMQPRSQSLNLSGFRRKAAFYSTIKTLASLSRVQNSLPEDEKASLSGIIRNQVLEDSCKWLKLVLDGYDSNFNCSLEEFELLDMRIDIQQNLKDTSRMLDKSSSCEDRHCEFEFNQLAWIDKALPCEGESRTARIALTTHFGDSLRQEKDISIAPCA